MRVVSGLPTPAFTVGWLRPRVYVDAALAGLLTADELAAVLAHEEAHVARRDPLRLSALRFLACTLFFLPALRRLAADAADEAEIAADDRAAGLAGAGAPLALASAIVISATHWAREHDDGVAPRLDRRQGVAGFQRASGSGGLDFNQLVGVGVNLGKAILNLVPAQFQASVQPYVPNIVDGIHRAFSLGVAQTFYIAVAASLVAGVAAAAMIEHPLRTSMMATQPYPPTAKAGAATAGTPASERAATQPD